MFSSPLCMSGDFSHVLGFLTPHWQLVSYFSWGIPLLPVNKQSISHRVKLGA